MVCNAGQVRSPTTAAWLEAEVCGVDSTVATSRNLEEQCETDSANFDSESLHKG